MTPQSPHAEFTEAARKCSDVILRRYSTSFALACRLLAPATRPHVAAIYAWARVGDEVVDGAMDDPVAARELIADARRRTHRAVERGLDPDPITHAFADTARRFGIGARLIDPFYDSMEADLEVTEHTEESLRRYIHGSAEVIGEMCLRTFAGGGLGDDDEMAAGARALGSAFQKVNFLRDIREDSLELGRNYLPGRDPRALTDRDLAELANDVDADLRIARASIEGIPGRDRLAVLAAHDLFAELNDRLRAAGAAGVSAGRVRVPNPVKLAVIGRAASGRGRSGAVRGRAVVR
ncbi:phytoene/squalene synthase family protein [Dietzia psychralcaliphila]|uniref:Bifunctional protein phytoene desaturase/synthetase n=1 Tax=Dietzia psychralcaliphila TaxID=139021 RepID=A0AAD0JS55_9ACTN|nr:phytoene/squalene synthase family protein [Dietzia psychralcaliphila]AWH96249.1 bifunctional protein phytoene desaturase/synthetase [Dietzia psychralcaliphila]PTM90676.1 phytoene/squalene synthetase [Dietzia psychralcaliphila]